MSSRSGESGSDSTGSAAFDGKRLIICCDGKQEKSSCEESRANKLQAHGLTQIAVFSMDKLRRPRMSLG
jgi:hypothetical protein